ncbi:MAG: protein kinase [Gammaproteobacteria bacterium]|nr:protein kinase [Gammaproteobacteria bacterium]
MIPKKDVVREEMLGEGAFGEVYAGTLKIKKKKQVEVALKLYKVLKTNKERRGQADAAVQTQKCRPPVRCGRRQAALDAGFGTLRERRTGRILE